MFCAPVVDIKYDLTDPDLTQRERELLTWPHADLYSTAWLNKVGDGHMPGVDRTIATSLERFDIRWRDQARYILGNAAL